MVFQFLACATFFVLKMIPDSVTCPVLGALPDLLIMLNYFFTISNCRIGLHKKALLYSGSKNTVAN